MVGNNRIPALRKTKVGRVRNRRLLVFLFLFFLCVLAVLFFRSSLSRITLIEVTGNRHLTSQWIENAARIQVGDSFFSVSAKTIQERIQSLDVVEKAEVDKRFPGKIFIRVKEFDEVAYVVSSDAIKAIVLENGIQIPVEHFSGLIHKPLLSGWHDKETFAKLCKVLADIPPEQLADISEIRPDPSEAYPDKIKLYTKTKHEVVTTIDYLPQKIKYLRAYVSGREPGYITMLETDYYRPYVLEEEVGKKETTQ